MTVLGGKKSKVLWTSFTNSNSEKGRKEGGERLWHLEMFHDFEERKAVTEAKIENRLRRAPINE